MTDYDIDELLEQLGQHPDDDNLLAIIALYYIENPEGDKDLEYLEKAYQTNPSIENTHNLAFQLNREYWSEEKRGIELQKQALLLQPQSYYPYASYAQMLSFDVGLTDDSFAFKSVEHYQEVIKYCLIAMDKYSNAPLKHRQLYPLIPIGLYNNIACSCTMLDDYDRALSYFLQCIQLLENLNSYDFGAAISQAILDDEKYKLLLNQTRLYILIGNRQQALMLLSQLQKNTQCDNLDIANLYAIIGEYELASEMVSDNYIDDSWEWIWYAIYQADQDKWHRMKQVTLENEVKSLAESQAEAENYRVANELDLLEQENEAIEHTKNVISNIRVRLKADSYHKPDDSIKKEFLRTFFGCLLFGCHVHGNLMDDTMAMSAQE
ncbi:hypothetical protein [Psychrobacter sp. DAB_AL62B]|nr:hypothetical protein [Psychrobacter sp. DAB_AL62B]MDE4454542.1 hypothetical protein [Psychrobacter sp. DAB_AL62B]